MANPFFKPVEENGGLNERLKTPSGGCSRLHNDVGDVQEGAVGDAVFALVVDQQQPSGDENLLRVLNPVSLATRHVDGEGDEWLTP
jgi:hypothetical protein